MKKVITTTKKKENYWAAGTGFTPHNTKTAKGSNPEWSQEIQKSIQQEKSKLQCSLLYGFSSLLKVANHFSPQVFFFFFL